MQWGLAAVQAPGLVADSGFRAWQSFLLHRFLFVRAAIKLAISRCQLTISVNSTAIKNLSETEILKMLIGTPPCPAGIATNCRSNCSNLSANNQHVERYMIDLQIRYD
jgi:TusA-related sulfurtransferase